ncbi:ATP-dependent helicase [Candidatus Dojkabacteria bacterium]|nr:ATP-dependent helicase [Candidatus Dojkabacteria bacterium]
MDLNKSQLEAVNHKSGPLLIIAGAGTGKTAVITQRILNIVNKGWAKPSEILALTFTEKASKEMLERVDVAMPYGYEEVWISTFHSFCDRILRQESIFLGLNPNYKLMTEVEAYMLFRKHIFEMPLDIFRPLGNPSGFISQILSHFSRLQDEDVTPEDYIKYANGIKEDDDTKGLDKKQMVELANAYKFFTELKLKESRLDFGDLINTVIKLFRDRPNILKKYHEKFKYILVDEYQDTNYTQNVLVNMLATGKDPKDISEKESKSANITVVGDDDQSIYKFRGAAISNIIQFKDVYSTAKRIVLTENYRSKQEILDCAYRLIQNNNPYRLEVTEQTSKRLIARADYEKDEKDAVKLILSNTGSNEADQIAKLISEMVEVEKKYTYSDMAILVRAHTQSEDFIQALRYRGIPYRFGGAKGLYNTDEIKVLISYLRLLSDYDHGVSMFNILSMKVWGFEAREVVELMRYSRKTHIPLFELFEKIVEKEEEVSQLKKRLNNTALTAISNIVKLLRRGFELVKEGKGVGHILYEFFDKSGWKDNIIKEDNQKDIFKVENIRKYFEMLKEFEKSNVGATIYEYLDYLDYSLEIGENPSTNGEAVADFEGVNISTVHGSKGLEFPVVFIVNLVEDRFPTRAKYDKLAIPNDLIKEVLPSGEEVNEHLHEERRLFYVGVTRAKEKLFLSVAKSYSGAGRIRKVSGFLNEVLGRDVNEDLKSIKDTEDSVDFQVFQRLDNSDIIDYKKVGVELKNQFSYSQIASYEMCPRQYKYSYVLKIPLPTNAALSFGNTVHNVLRTFYEKLAVANEGLEGFVDKPGKKDLLDLYETFWQPEGYESKAHEKKRFEFGKKALERYFESFHTGTERTLFLEKSFKYSMSDFRVLGKVDRVDLLGIKDGVKHVEIIDYKTGKAKSQKDANTQWQLVFYALVAEALWGVKVDKASYIYVEHSKKVEISVTDRRKKNVIKKIENIVGKIRAGDFTIPRSHNCMYCNYQDVCEEAIL